jgi:hypothetical protein
LRTISLIVEGNGDASAIPTLVAKTGILFDMPIVSKTPIVVGEFGKNARPGVIERYVQLASNHDDICSVLVVLDLDDSCVLNIERDFRERIVLEAAKSNKRGCLCFCIREYEAWLLHAVDDIGFAESDSSRLIGATLSSPEDIRGAKEKLSELMGRRYKPAVHQNEYTKMINLRKLFERSRSYRKFCKELTGLEYDFMQEYIAEKDSSSDR